MAQRKQSENSRRLSGVQIVAQEHDIIGTDGRVSIFVFHAPNGYVVAEERGTDRRHENVWQNVYLDHVHDSPYAAQKASSVLARFSGLDTKLEQVLTDIVVAATITTEEGGN